jgi:hypothetical protein
VPIFLDGMAIQFFRGVGPNIQRMAPFRSFNFFVGANNAGKSTALDCLHRYVKHGPGSLNPSDEHRGDVSGQFTVAMAMRRRWLDGDAALVRDRFEDWFTGLLPKPTILIRQKTWQGFRSSPSRRNDAELMWG